MSWGFFIEAGHVVAFIAQAGAIVLALRLISISESRKAWLLISLAIMLMEVSRFSNLVGWDETTLIQLLRPVVSLLLLGGIASIAPVFRTIKEAREQQAQLNEELAKERNLLQAVLTQMPAGVVVAEVPSGRLITGNEQVEKIWRMPFVESRDIEHYRSYSGFHSDGRPYEPQEWPLARSVLKGESVVSEEIDILRGDGTPGTIVVSSRPTFARQDRITAGVAVFFDVTEQKRMERELRQNEQQLQTIFEAVQDGIITVDDRCRYIGANPAAASIYGVSPDRLIGRLISDFTEPTFDLEAAWQAFLEAGHYKSEDRIVQPGGTASIVEVFGRANVLPGRHLFVVRDITERKRVEEALRRTREQLEGELADTRLLQEVSAALVEQDNAKDLHEKILDAAVAVMGSDFASMQMLHPERGSGGELHLLAFRGFNPQAARLWEWVRTDSSCTCGRVLRTGKRVIAPDVEKCELMAGSSDQAAYLQAGIRAVQTTPLLTRTGKLVGMISTHWSNPHQPSGRDLRLLDILARQAADLIERRQAEEALRRSEERFRRLVEVSSNMVWVTDARGEPLEDSPSWRAFTGCTFEQWVGWNWLDIFHPDDRERLANTWRASLTEVIPYRIEARMLHSSGEYRYVLCQAAPILNADGEVREWVGMNTDVTNFRKNEARLHRFYESGMIGVIYYGLDGLIADANDRFLEMVGYTRQDLEAGLMDWEKMTPPEYRPLDEHAIAELKATGVDTPYEKEYIRKDGSRIPIIIGAATTDEERHEGIAFVLDITERKQTEEKLNRAYELNKAVLDTIDGLIVVLDRHGRIVRFNAACERLTGWLADEVIGRCFWEFLVPEEQRAGVLDVFNQLASGMFPNRHENEWVLRDGSRRWITWANSSLLDAGGAVEYVLGTGIDISERKEAEQALRESEKLARDREAQIRAILDATPAIIWTAHDPECRHISGNRAARELAQVGSATNLSKSGPEAEHLSHYRVSKDGRELAPEEMPLQVVAHSGRALRDYSFEFTLEGGKQYSLLGNVVPVVDYEGNPNGSIGAFVDITEHKRMEEELRKSRDELELRVEERTAELLHANEVLQLNEARFEALYHLSRMSEASREDIATFVLEHVVALTKSKMAWIGFMNADETATLVHSWSKSAMAECAIPDKPMHFPVKGAGVWADCIRERKVVIINDYTAPHVARKGCPEGHVELHRLLGAPVFDGDRLVALGVVGNKEEDYDSADVHQMSLLLDGMWKHVKQKEDSEGLRIYAQKLQESNQALQDFASIASHDMQEPLRKVMAFGSRLSDNYGDLLGKQGKDYLDRMLSATNRMQSLLDALLNYSRVTTGAEPFVEVDLSQLVKEVLSDLETRIEQTGGHVEIGDLPKINADASQMRQLMQNIIGNALKYHGDENPVVKVYGETHNDYCRIYVEDNGIGFDEKHADRIFQPFQRLHGRGSGYDGTGMGLAICRKIVERHGGSISARSAPGKGSTFVVTLPAPHGQ